MNNNKKIGLYGGTFDPVHRSHIELARAALRELFLDHVAFLPTVRPPHKEGRTPYNHRLQMLQSSLEDEQEWQDGRFIIETIEEKLPFPSYSYNTITALLQHSDASLFFIIGSDSFLDITNWYNYQKIITIVNLVISPRKGYRMQELNDTALSLGYSRCNYGWQNNTKKDLYLLKYTPPFISSTDIKSALRYGDEGLYAARTMLKPQVVAYILKHQLYC